MHRLVPSAIRHPADCSKLIVSVAFQAPRRLSRDIPKTHVIPTASLAHCSLRSLPTRNKNAPPPWCMACRRLQAKGNYEIKKRSGDGGFGSRRKSVFQGTRFHRPHWGADSAPSFLFLLGSHCQTHKLICVRSNQKVQYSVAHTGKPEAPGRPTEQGKER